MSKINISLDVETLGTSKKSVISQIGAVKFTDDGEIVDRFISNIDIKVYDNPFYRGLLDIDIQTVVWWLNQDEKAQKSVYSFGLKREHPEKALIRFAEWASDDKEVVFWSHNSFDPSIVEENFKVWDLSCPIHRHNSFDIRTLFYFVPKDESVEHVGVKHNALHDAIHQARQVSKSLQKLKKAMTYV